MSSKLLEVLPKDGASFRRYSLYSPFIESVTSMETLEFVIYPDGRVQEKVTGIVGASCAEVTAAIEAQLGQVLNQELTSDYFSQPLQQSASTMAQATRSEW